MSTETVKEAGRVMTICNACRYCEGFCAVFPAMELRRTFTEGDLKYLANLCHNCRDCYYACQYAPPHDFDLNFPKAMAELRVETYSEFAWPRRLNGLFRRNGITVLIVTLLSIVAVYVTTLIAKGSETIFAVHTGANSFYQVIPYLSMIVPFSLIARGQGSASGKEFRRSGKRWESPRSVFPVEQATSGQSGMCCV